MMAMSIERTQFFEIMSHFASGVTVVTTMYNGRPNGLTVSAFASLSASPTLVLVSIDSSGQSCDAIREAGMYAVNILAEDQDSLSTHFARRIEDKFVDVDYTLGEAGLPLLAGTVAFIECRVVAAIPGGDHTIFIGEVLHGATRGGRPLLYFDRQYHRLP